MTNPTIQTDLAEILQEIRQDLKSIDSRLNKLEVGQTEIKGKIETLEEKIETNKTELNGKIETLDQKLSGKIETLNQKVSGQKEVVEKTTGQLEKRIANQELSNRIVLGGLALTILGGIASYFGWISKP